MIAGIVRPDIACVLVVGCKARLRLKWPVDRAGIRQLRAGAFRVAALVEERSTLESWVTTRPEVVLLDLSWIKADVDVELVEADQEEKDRAVKMLETIAKELQS